MSYRGLGNVKLLCALFAVQYQFLYLRRLKSPYGVDSEPIQSDPIRHKTCCFPHCVTTRGAAQPDCSRPFGVICLVHPWLESQSLTSKKYRDNQAAIGCKWELILSPSSINVTVQVQGIKGEANLNHLLPRKYFVCSLCSQVTNVRGKQSFQLPLKESSQLWVRHPMLEKCKVSNVPAYTVLPTGNSLIYLLNCSGLHSHASFFDPYERSPVMQEFSVSFQAPKNKVLQHLACSARLVFLTELQQDSEEGKTSLGMPSWIVITTVICDLSSCSPEWGRAK